MFDPIADLEARGFQVFSGRGTRVLANTPRMGIQLGRGLLSLNDAAYSALGQPSAVVLAYNPEDNEVALRRAGQEAYASPVRKQRSARSSYLVSVRAFLNHIGLQGEGVIQGCPKQKGEWLILNLSTASHLPRRSRTRTKRPV